MIEANPNHCKVVADSLTESRETDEQTFASLAVLRERLERLKGISETFAGVEFSPSVRELQESTAAVAVG